MVATHYADWSDLLDKNRLEEQRRDERHAQLLERLTEHGRQLHYHVQSVTTEEDVVSTEIHFWDRMFIVDVVSRLHPDTDDLVVAALRVEFVLDDSHPVFLQTMNYLMACAFRDHVCKLNTWTRQFENMSFFEVMTRFSSDIVRLAEQRSALCRLPSESQLFRVELIPVEPDEGPAHRYVILMLEGLCKVQSNAPLRKVTVFFELKRGFDEDNRHRFRVPEDMCLNVTAEAIHQAINAVPLGPGYFRRTMQQLREAVLCPEAISS